MAAQRGIDAQQFDLIMAKTVEGLVKEATGVALPDKVAKTIYRQMIIAIFQHATTFGYLRFPDGLGSLAIRLGKGQPKKTPKGVTVELAGVPRLVYREGLTVKSLLGKHDRYATRRKNPRAFVKNVLGGVES